MTTQPTATAHPARVVDPDLTVTINRSDLEAAMTGEGPLASQVADGRAVLDGEASILTTLQGLLVHFELGFEIMPGAGTTALSPALDGFAQEDLADTAGD